MKVLSSIFAIIGMIVGSGFVSGREIVVYFTRFGILSIPCILIVFFMFWGLLHFLLNYQENNGKVVKNSKISNIINVFITFIFSSSMIAGISDFITFDNKILSILLYFIIILLCFLIYKNGASFFNKVNLFLIPLMILFLIVSIGVVFKMPKFNLEIDNFSFLSFFYAILYCILNTSSGSMIIISLGSNLTKKQKARVSFFSALVLCILLLVTNLVLLANPNSFSFDMPLLSLFSGAAKIIMNFVVLIGCLTTLFSLIYSSSTTIRGLCNYEILIFGVSVMFPFIFSLLGFGFIVTYLYPLASALGIYLLIELFYKSKAKKKIKCKAPKS